MTGESEVLRELGLLSWRTAEFGFQRGWVGADAIAELAVHALGTMPEADPDIASRAVADSLARDEIGDLLGAVRGRLDDDVDTETVSRRWLLGRLLSLKRQSIDDESFLSRAEETYAEFGFPEELDGVSRYDVTQADRLSDPAAGDRVGSPLDAIDRVVATLRADLVPPR